MPVLNDADDVKLGSSQVDAVYLGSNLVWPPPVPAELVSWAKTVTFGATANVPYPASIVAGNTLLMVLTQSGKTVTAPGDGFAQLQAWGGSKYSDMIVWSKVASGSETGTIALAMSAAVQNVAYMVQVNGPVDVSSAIVAGDEAPSLTATTSGLLLAFIGSKDVTAPYTTYTAPTGMTKVDESIAQYDQHVSAFAVETVPAGATGTRLWTVANGGSRVSFGVVISDPA